MFEVIVTTVLPFIAIAIFITFFIMLKSVRKVSLQKQAIKRNGQMKEGGLFSNARLSLFQNGIEIAVYSRSGGKNSPPYTFVVCDLNSLRNYKFKIYREHRIFGIGTVFGQDIKLNNPSFDENYVIQGSDELIVRQFLTEDIQAKILEFREHNPIIEIRKNKFKFSVPYIPKDEQGYDQIIDAGLLFIEQAQKIG